MKMMLKMMMMMLLVDVLVIISTRASGVVDDDDLDDDDAVGGGADDDAEDDLTMRVMMQPVLGSSRCCDVHVAAASPVAGIFTPQSRRLKHEEAARSPGTRHRNRTGAAPLPHHSTADTGGGDAEKAGGGGAEESGGGDAEEAGGAAGGGGGATALPGVPKRHDVVLGPTRVPMGLRSWVPIAYSCNSVGIINMLHLGGGPPRVVGCHLIRMALQGF